MLFKRKDGNKVDNDLLLRANIAQGIKLLYFDRNRLFYAENKHYKQLEDTFEHISKNIRKLEKKKPRMLVVYEDHLDYEVLTDQIVRSVTDYLNFLLYLPPPTFIFSKWKKSIELGKMKVPTISYILNSLLNYKTPEYWRNNLEPYTNMSAAMIDILSETSSSVKIIEVTEKIRENINKEVDKLKKEEYKKKLLEWMRLGLIV